MPKDPEKAVAELREMRERRKAKRKADGLAKVRKKRAKARRERLEIFRVKYTEGRLAYSDLIQGHGKEVSFTDEEQDKLAELVEMLVREDLLRLYPTWAMRAVALGVTHNRIATWRNSKLFKQMLVKAMQGEALVGAANALPAQIAHAARPDTKGGNQSFKNLTDLAGISQPKALTLTQTNVNMTWEQQLARLTEGSVVDAEAEETD